MSVTANRAPTLLERWASLAYRRRWRVLIGWVMILLGLGIAAAMFGGEFSDTFEIPGTESQAAFDLLEENFPSDAGGQANLVFKAQDGIADPAVTAAIADTLGRIEALPGVVWVQSPLDIPQYVSADGTIARSVLQFEELPGDITASELAPLFAIVDDANQPGLTVEVGGGVVTA